MTTHKSVSLLPTLIPFLGMFLNVAVRHFSKGASAALGSFLGRRVFTFYHAQHHLSGQLARIR
jgi:hypothetical protein